jgi:exonuclease VII large subunit
MSKNKSELVQLINDIIDEKIGAVYVASTLCIFPPDDELHIYLNISDDNQSEEVLYALAKCYIKYKTENHCHWKLAHEIIKRNELKKDYQ